ncbi:MAG: High-affnity carbon uptake protein Hat/HatR [uncultured Sulfurovum sp.]|uniref:High-affnity carbon uptake protein Hat/HatR n=1 Tax=uncultured Sulfurovum sp. TaxID=269237 RepID=A0A6S6TYB5_9BACT|nr:MAG: High-affnity carbon uptake protein Hat/HatR [uncultured Sulfurovum sp.]
MMKSLPLLLTMLLFLLLGCTPNPSPSNPSQPTKTSTQAILKLDTKGHTAKIQDIIVTQSGDIISASDDKTIRVWDSRTGKEKRKILGQIGAGAEGKIFAMALSSNEKFLAVGGFLAEGHGVNDDLVGSIRIYHYPTGKLLNVLKSHTDVVRDLAFSPDGRYLISGSADKTAKIWNVGNFSLKETLSFHSKQVYAVKIMKKGKQYFALTAGFDNQIVLYNMQSKAIKRDRKNYKLHSLAISKNHIAVCGESKEIQIYNHALNPIQTIASKTKPAGLAYSANGEFLMAGSLSDFNYELVNIYAVNEQYQKRSSFQQHKNLTKAVAFLDEQTALSAGGDNKEMYIWDRESAKVKGKIEGVGATVWSVGLKGERLAWGNESLNHTQLKTHTGKLQKTLNLKTFSIQNATDQNYHRIATIQGDYILSHKAGGNYGRSDAILELQQDGKPIQSIVRDATNGVRHRCYGFYKDYIISGGSNGFLKIYNFQGQEIANLVGHTGEVWSIALDGDRLVSGSSDQTIKIWDLSKLQKTMRPQLSLFVSKTNDWVAWTKEGFYNASKGAEEYIGYHINQGANKEAKFLDVSRFRKQFYRPDLISKAIAGEDLSHYAKGIDIDSILKAGLPPKVEMLSTSRTMDAESATVGVKVCDEGGGIENLSFYLNNKAISYMSQSKAFRNKKEVVGNCTVLEQSIAVPSGEHVIGFNATNKEGNIVSNTPSITIVNNKKVERKPNLHLLTLSINDYKDDSLDLKFPNNDADKLSQKLKSIGKPVFENVYSYALKDQQVTQEQIDRKVAEIAGKVGVEDVFVLYISGHGITNDQDGDYYFIPYDAKNGSDVTKTAINQEVFKSIMSQIKAVKSVILLDTCQSGSMASQELVNTSVNRFGGNVGSAIIAGATSGQNAIDGYKEHGIFTYTVLDAMSNKKVYDFQDRLSIGDIAKYVKYLLPKLAKEKFNHAQKPTIYMNGDTSFAIGGLE